MAKYSNEIKKEMCIKVCIKKESTIKTASEYNVPIKTFENWITAFNKDSSVFDKEGNKHYNVKLNTVDTDIDYSMLSREELESLLMKRDIEISRLKKGYSVKGRGQEKEYVIYKMKNTK
jgi:transposase